MNPTNTPPQPEQKNLLDTREAATFLDLKKETLESWRTMKRAGLSFVRIGGNIRYRRQDLEAFIAANVVTYPA